jgi:hypothetical protein
VDITLGDSPTSNAEQESVHHRSQAGASALAALDHERTGSRPEVAFDAERALPLEVHPAGLFPQCIELFEQRTCCSAVSFQA